MDRDHGRDPAADGQILNIGNPAEVTIAELAETIRDRFAPGAEIVFEPGRPGDPQRRRPDIRRIRDAYGWEPRVSLEEGLELSATWIREARGSMTSPSGAGTGAGVGRFVSAITS